MSPKASSLDPSAGQFREERTGFHKLRQPRGTPPGHLPRRHRHRGQGRDRAPGDTGTIHGSEDLDADPRGIATPDLDPYGPQAALGVRTTHHRKPGRQAIATSGRQPGGHPADTREGRDQEEGVGQAGSVAVDGADRIGEPAELTPRAPRPALPTTVAPVDRLLTERLVVAPGARGTTGT